jgi:hypothetical protein
MPAGRAGKMFFSGQERTVPAQPAPGPAARKKILNVRSERSERPVAGTDVRRRLTKPERDQPQSGRHHGGRPDPVRTQGSSSEPRPLPRHRELAAGPCQVAGQDLAGTTGTPGLALPGTAAPMARAG